jgi:hypothetical protein
MACHGIGSGQKLKRPAAPTGHDTHNMRVVAGYDRSRCELKSWRTGRRRQAGRQTGRHAVPEDFGYASIHLSVSFEFASSILAKRQRCVYLSVCLSVCRGAVMPCHTSYRVTTYGSAPVVTY